MSNKTKGAVALPHYDTIRVFSRQTINVTHPRNVKRVPKHPEYRKMLRELRQRLGLQEPAR